jgi:hypothetical protein
MDRAGSRVQRTADQGCGDRSDVINHKVASKRDLLRGRWLQDRTKDKTFLGSELSNGIANLE